MKPDAPQRHARETPLVSDLYAELAAVTKNMFNEPVTSNF
jgi:hypothetical protein